MPFFKLGYFPGFSGGILKECKILAKLFPEAHVLTSGRRFHERVGVDVQDVVDGEQADDAVTVARRLRYRRQERHERRKSGVVGVVAAAYDGLELLTVGPVEEARREDQKTSNNFQLHFNNSKSRLLS